jgi:hypothetical protein
MMFTVNQQNIYIDAVWSTLHEANDWCNKNSGLLGGCMAHF